MSWKKTLIESKAIYPMVLAIILTTAQIVVDATVLKWIAIGVSMYADPMRPIVMVATLSAIIIGISSVERYISSICPHLIYSELYTKIMNKVLYSDYNLFTKFSPSDVVTTCDRMWSIANVPSSILYLVRYFISFTVNAIAIIAIDRRLALPIIVIYSIGGVVLWKSFVAWNTIDSKADAIKRKRNKELDDVINGFQEVRSFPNADDRHKKSIEMTHKEVLGLILQRCRVGSECKCIIATVDAFVTVVSLIYVVTALQVGIISEESLGVSLVMYAWRLLDPLINFIDVASSYSDATSAIPNYRKLMEYENMVHDGTIELESFDGEIEIKDLSFAYEKSGTVLDNVSITIKKGEHVGICGPSGGGKTTLLKLLPRFYDPMKGSIRIDGIDLRELTRNSIRKHIGIVHQNPYIFNGTILENIRYANPDASFYQIEEACKKANLYEFIISLKDGFDTEVGARGLKLSGGQKQRISIARIFLNDPDILILDEATSALDNTTESIIQDALNTVFQNKTQIVVAHRLSTIKNSDKIVVIANHHIEEVGTHDELMQTGGMYTSMNK